MNDVVFECCGRHCRCLCSWSCYLIWKQQYEQRECSANAIKQDMLRELRRDLDQQEQDHALVVP